MLFRGMGKEKYKWCERKINIIYLHPEVSINFLILLLICEGVSINISGIKAWIIETKEPYKKNPDNLRAKQQCCK